MVLDYPKTFGLMESLPVELVAAIFCRAITAWSPHTTPRASGGIGQELNTLHLGAVCKSWREIAWRTPTLWSGVRIYATPERIATQVVLLDEWLSRSGSLPLDITLCSPNSEDWPRGEGLGPHSLLLIANRYASRWHCLVLQLPGYSCRALPGPHTQLPLLEELRIDPNTNNSNDLISLQGATNLRYFNLNLSTVYLATIDVPLSNITHLNLDFCDLPELLYLISRCPVITDVVVQYLRPDSVGIAIHNLFDIPELPLALPSVRALKLRDADPSEVNLLFNSIITPELKEFTYDGWPPTDVTPFSTFLSRCPTLQHFRLFDQNLSSQQMIQILQELKTIKSFTLDVSHSFEHRPLDDQLLELLHPSSGTPYLLPMLEEFTFTGDSSFTWPCFIAAWKARRNIMGSGLVEWKSWTFTITPGSVVSNEILDELKQLEIETGGQLKLSFLNDI